MDNSVKVFELSYLILEEVLKLKDYKDKDEVMFIMSRAREIVMNDEEADDILKESYAVAEKKMAELSFEEMKGVRDVLKV